MTLSIINPLSVLAVKLLHMMSLARRFL